MDRTLPHNLEAEKCVLGAILINNHAFNQAAEVIDAQDFFRDAHRRIFDKMVALTDRREPVDLVTLKDELARSNELEEVGGPAYISSLTDGVPRSANVEYYAKIVKEKSTLRRLIQSANDVLGRAYEAEQDADVLLDEAERSIFQIAEHRMRAGFVSVGELVGWRLPAHRAAAAASRPRHGRAERVRRSRRAHLRVSRNPTSSSSPRGRRWGRRASCSTSRSIAASRRARPSASSAWKWRRSSCSSA